MILKVKSLESNSAMEGEEDVFKTVIIAEEITTTWEIVGRNTISRSAINVGRLVINKRIAGKGVGQDRRVVKGKEEVLGLIRRAVLGNHMNVKNRDIHARVLILIVLIVKILDPMTSLH